jgi:hypothetical protein
MSEIFSVESYTVRFLLNPSGRSLRSYLTRPEAGMEIFTFFAAVYCISHRPPEYRKRQKFYIIFGGTLLALVTIDVAMDALWGQYMWIDHRNYPGGPLKFYAASEAAWYSVLHLTSAVLANILGDGLLVRHFSP